ncbi:hypothetical protein HHK36_020357 [Tetracentron sinense]|uniref:Protein DA1-like domain-containing protein n=1 Tax=Tetracentron sinense TaxID=13715 RepID=A0A834YX00_TETSI|nr:hypothetical protein HHK36_020357 [Tetracentron sinense]
MNGLCAGKRFQYQEQIIYCIMEWLQQLFDGPSYEASKWKYHGKDARSQDENEDVDQSLSEERKGKRVIGYNSLQRVLNIGRILSGTKNIAATIAMMVLLGALAANPRHTHYTSIEDGRKFCPECLETAVMSTEECQPLYVAIQDFFEGLNMKVEQQVPELRALCMSETRDVNSVVRSNRVMEAFQINIMKKKPYKLKRRKWEVTAIIILSGLPRLLTGSILAHELMHAWMRLKGYSPVSRDVKEGICQVLAHMWLESEIMASSSLSSTI